MATADHVKDNFASQLKRIRAKIRQKITELIDRVKARESELLNELDTVLNSYNKYLKQFEEQSERKKVIRKTITFLEEEYKNSFVKALHEELLKRTKYELEKIEIPKGPKMVHFVCDIETISRDLNKFVKLVEHNIAIDYKDKVLPLLSSYDEGKGLGRKNNSWGIAVDNKTGRIYVAYYWDSCVKVFDTFGKFLFLFGDKKGKDRLHHPTCLRIIADRIMITHSDCILVYQLNGEYVTEIGESGTGKLEFNFPQGLDCNEINEDIYICDYYNDRIQIISKHFLYKSQFGADKLNHPRDIKLTKDYIYILDESNPCLHLYSYDLILQKSFISSGIRMEVVDPYCFFIDGLNNILISDCNSNIVLIFNSGFELIHKFAAKYPKGITVDNNGRIIIAGYAKGECLQIF